MLREVKEDRGNVEKECWKGWRDGEDEEGTHGWLNPSLVTPSRRQGAHTFPSFSLQEKGSGHARGWGQKGEGQTSGTDGKKPVLVSAALAWPCWSNDKVQ